jgi:hypothetical protein
MATTLAAAYSMAGRVADAMPLLTQAMEQSTGTETVVYQALSCLSLGESQLLAGQVASSSVSYDLHAKLHVYRCNGVCEYLVWRVLEREVDWFALRDGQDERIPTDAEGRLRSEVFPRLWLDLAALIRGDLATVLAVVQQGLTSPEHGAFITRLQPPADRL